MVRLTQEVLQDPATNVESRDRKSQKTLKSLQILRALAATSVVYYHIAATPVFGAFGVDIFFVISGFVMAMIVSEGQTASEFIKSRIIRIVPLYWTLTTLILLLALVRPELLNSTSANLFNYLKSIFFVPYFKENGSLQPMLAVGWTLNFEMFFYVCVWLAIVLARRHWLAITALLLITVRFLLGNFVLEGSFSAFFQSDLWFEFLAGMVVYQIHLMTQHIRKSLTVLIILALGAYVAMALAEFHKLDVYRFWLYAPPSVLLVYCVLNLEEFIEAHQGKVVNWLVDMGDASYATYLSHYYVVEGFRKIIFPKFKFFPIESPLGVLVTVGAALCVGHLLHRGFDRPLNRLLRRKMRQRNLALA